ncbi:MAG: exo-alpha-sialidase [Chloroflexi bacterium]|nr:MAG: exo-alpha-sialidase [Chloroflexota bacterium]
MVRTLTTTLTATVNATTRVPALNVTLEDHIQHFAQYKAPNNADAWHDACIANDGSIIRVQVTRGGTGFAANFQFQRVADPTSSSQWQGWTTLGGGSGNCFQDAGCAVSNNNGTLRAFVQRGTGGANIWVWTSNDNGQTWSTSPTSILTPPGNALLKGISSAGNNDVFFLYDVLGGDAIGCSFFSGGSWSALRTWTLATITSGAGLSAYWTGTLYQIAYSDSYTLKQCSYHPTTTTWTALPDIAPATSTAIGRIAPHLTFDSSTGLYNLVVCEIDTGLLTGAVYQYPRVRQSSDLQHWSSGFIMHDITEQYGAVLLQRPGDGSYLTSMALIMRSPNYASTNATQFLDVSNAILSYTRHETINQPSRLEIVLDNNRGTFNAKLGSASNYQPLNLNCSLVLSEGYKTGNPPSTREVVKVGTYRIARIQFKRSPTANQVSISAIDRSRDLDLLNRFQTTYTNQTVSYLITEICVRAGLFSLSLPTTAQISQQIPIFVLQAGQSYRHALDNLCTTYALAYFLDQNEQLVFRESSNSDPVTWSYQPEIELLTMGADDQRGNHVIVTGKPPTSAPIGALTTGETYDDPHMHQVGLERIIQHIDQKLTTTAQCNLKASFILSQERRNQITHQVTIPANPALQLLDVISLTDYNAPQGIGDAESALGGTAARITHSELHYEAQSATYKMVLQLEGV